MIEWSFAYISRCFKSFQSSFSFIGDKVRVDKNNGEFDFREPKQLGDALSKLSGSGFDHTFCRAHHSTYCARLPNSQFKLDFDLIFRNIFYSLWFFILIIN